MDDESCPACGGTLDLDGFCSECDAYADDLIDLEDECDCEDDDDLDDDYSDYEED